MKPYQRMLSPLLSLLATACAPLPIDPDGDGYIEDDCAAHYAAVHPGAEDPYGDGVDQDCDGRDGAESEFDLDGDGQRSEAFGGRDCDDEEPAIYAGAEEECGDGLVNDCDRSAVSASLDCRMKGDLLTEARYTLVMGHAPGARGGRSLAGVGDIDGDGLDDVLVGAPGSLSDDAIAGAVYLIAAPSAGTLDMSQGEAPMLVGASPGDGAGHGISGAGDLDGDGFGDIAAGVPEAGYGSDGIGGALHVILGPVNANDDETPQLLGEYAFATVSGPQHLGAAVSLIDDVDGDQRGELLTGASMAYDERGAVYLLTAADIDAAADNSEGATTESASMVVVGAHKVAGEMSGSLSGWPLCGADRDGDGVPEVVTGAYRDASASDREYEGAVSVMSVGAGVYSAEDADLTLIGGVAHDNLGYSVACGDLNGDGLADLIAGAPSYHGGGDRPGKAYLVSASQVGRGGSVDVAEVALAVFTGSVNGESVGTSVVVPGDLDGDEVDDLVIGAAAWGEELDTAGSAHLFYASAELEGQIAVSAAPAFMTGQSAGDYAGAAVAGAGDVDGDGWPDLIIGAPFDSQSGTESGRAYILFGGGY